MCYVILCNFLPITLVFLFPQNMLHICWQRNNPKKWPHLYLLHTFHLKCIIIRRSRCPVLDAISLQTPECVYARKVEDGWR